MPRFPFRRALDLTGDWQMALCPEESAPPLHTVAGLQDTGWPIYPARVPGNFELDLHAAGVIPDPFQGMNLADLRRYENHRVYYFRHFPAPPSGAGDLALLLEGVDCDADIWLNGELLGSQDNMLVEHRWPVGKLQPENELIVAIHPAGAKSRPDATPPGVASGMACGYDSLYVRKAPHMYGWDIMPRALSAGIWRPVSLVWLPPDRLEHVYLETLSASSDHARLALRYDCHMGKQPVTGFEIEVEGVCGDSRFSGRARMLDRAGRLDIGVPHPLLWWPRGRGDAALYAVTIRLIRDGEVVDTAQLRHGIRTVEVVRTSVTDEAGSGEFCFSVNGERLFVMGSNWVPADAYHSRDRERIPDMLALAEEAGCNMLRCWGGNVYEDDLFYDLCDEKGILVWQDFAMACALYPQDEKFQGRLSVEVRKVVRRLREHACLALWAGDNECDQATEWMGWPRRNPNDNVLTRQLIPAVLRDEDPGRPYLPSSPYVDQGAFRAGLAFLPENHLWGPRDYYKSEFYQKSLCHFASEIGYHGCPTPESVRSFISPEKLWPPGNDEWLLHATSPIPGVDLCDYRIQLMVSQVRNVFGETPDNLDDFSFASQCVQAEAFKFFIEMFRTAKWRRTGILWWNLIDGWPQFSDAVVDYYFRKKLAFDAIYRAQQPLLFAFREPAGGAQELVACNDVREDLRATYRVWDAESRETVLEGAVKARADSVTPVGSIQTDAEARRFLCIEWASPLGAGCSHYLAGRPPFNLGDYRRWLQWIGPV